MTEADALFLFTGGCAGVLLGAYLHAILLSPQVSESGPEDLPKGRWQEQGSGPWPTNLYAVVLDVQDGWVRFDVYSTRFSQDDPVLIRADQRLPLEQFRLVYRFLQEETA